MLTDRAASRIRSSILFARSVAGRTDVPLTKKSFSFSNVTGAARIPSWSTDVAKSVLELTDGS
ncbi:hypothetical protein [Tateyamaria sp. Alg231-49]|uniref:hypothetical protein n=1 Tax=Tateyamaria sp. Alg231-49 TaxID=1922219 RepID=UPI001F24F344|nr:hypothetical protein [Tateyamaria sp. Alg231-49]